MKKLHIVNGKSAAGSLKQVFKDDNLNEVYCFEDFLSIGPLFKIDTNIGQDARRLYFSELIQKTNSDYPTEKVTNNISDLEKFDFTPYKKITIWHGNNAPEYLLKLLCCKFIENKKLYKVNVSKEKIGIRTPIAVGECTLETLRELVNSSSKISKEKQKEHVKEWDEIALSESKLRIKNNDKIEAVSDDYFDDLIISKCTDDYLHAFRIIGQAMGETDHVIGDNFITYRLMHLIDKKKINYTGNLKNLRDLHVKIGY